MSETGHKGLTAAPSGGSAHAGEAEGKGQNAEVAVQWLALKDRAGVPARLVRPRSLRSTRSRVEPCLARANDKAAGSLVAVSPAAPRMAPTKMRKGDRSESGLKATCVSSGRWLRLNQPRPQFQVETATWQCYHYHAVEVLNALKSSGLSWARRISCRAHHPVSYLPATRLCRRGKGRKPGVSGPFHRCDSAERPSDGDVPRQTLR